MGIELWAFVDLFRLHIRKRTYEDTFQVISIVLGEIKDNWSRPLQLYLNGWVQEL